MASSRAQRTQLRLPAEDSAASSAPSSPEPPGDDDENFFATDHKNDSQSSFGNSTASRPGSMNSNRTARVPKSPVERLPNELLIAIFSKLGSPAELYRCVQVSKQWSACAVDLLWHRPLLTEVDRLVTISQAVQDPNALYPYHNLVRRLNMSNLAREVNDGTLEPFIDCKRVERLTLTGCTGVTDRALINLIEGNRALLALDVTSMIELTDLTVFTLARNCPKLQGLNVSGCDRITDESLLMLSLGCKYLKRLKFNKLKNVTDDAIISFAKSCPSMLEVDLQQCDNITDASVHALLSYGPSIRELRLSQCTNITDNAFLQLPRGLRLESLRIIDLTACTELTDAAVEKLIDAAPRLRIIVLAKCSNITDRSVQAICKLGKNLHDIHLGRCNQISDDALKKLVASCNRIRYIDLAACSHITDDSVKHLADLPKLRRIGLVKCGRVTDESISAIVKASQNGPHNLERVHLSYCTAVTVEVSNFQRRFKHPLTLTGNSCTSERMSKADPSIAHGYSRIPLARRHWQILSRGSLRCAPLVLTSTFTSP